MDEFLAREVLVDFVNLADDGIVAIDTEQRIIFFNQSAERIFGYASSEVIGEPLSVLLPVEAAGPHEAWVNGFAASPVRSRPMSMRSRVMGRRASGELFPADVAISRLREGAATVFTAVVRDATDRVREEMRFRTLVEGTSARTGREFFEGITKALATALGVRYVAVGELHAGHTSRIRNLAVWNEGRADAFEYVVLPESPCARLTTRRMAFWSELPPDAVTELERHLSFVPRGFLGLRLDAASGEAIGVIVAVDDKPMQFTTVAQDLLRVFGARAASEIERGRANIALQESEAITRSLVEGAPYGIFRASTTGRLQHANLALARMLGFGSERELLDAPAHHAQLIRGWSDARRGMSSDDPVLPVVECEWRRRDGTPLYVRLSGRTVQTPLASSEKHEIFVEDLSERRALELTLRQAQKMEAVGQLAGGLAHDFNNLLTIVQCAAANLELSAPSEREDLRVEVEEIAHAARRGAELVRNLLTFGRMVHVTLQPTDLVDLVRGTAGMVSRIIPHTVRLKVEADNDVPAVLADPGAIQHILLNLAKNAADAMPNGGSLTISIGKRGGGAPAGEGFSVFRGPAVELTVRDTGVGMDEDTVARVFEPFFTTKETGRGNGLGLAMVYGLVKQHSGDISMHSVVGAGTEVRIVLPATRFSAATRGTPQSIAAALDRAKGGSETILIVDDEEGIRRSAMRVLEERGYRVLTARDGRDALAVIGEHQGRIDLIISDVVMPRMSGPELFAILRRQGSVPRFMFTSGNPDRFPYGMRHEVDRDLPLLRKPWNAAELLESVRAQLSVFENDVRRGGAPTEDVDGGGEGTVPEAPWRG